MRIKLTIEAEIDETIFGLRSEDLELWIENEVIVGDGSCVLHSYDIGDEIAVIKKISKIEWIKK